MLISGFENDCLSEAEEEAITGSEALQNLIGFLDDWFFVCGVVRDVHEFWGNINGVSENAEILTQRVSEALQYTDQLDEPERAALCDFALEEAGNAGLDAHWIDDQYTARCRFG